MREYTILDASQLYTLLHRYGGVGAKSRRYQIIKALCRRKYVQYFRHEGKPCLSTRPDILPVGRYRHQIECFWILLDYLDQVDEHEATGMLFPIRMRIQGREYDLGYVEKGAEEYYGREIRRGGRKYILVVEDADRIPALLSENIAAIATVSRKKKIRYYTLGGDAYEDGAVLPADGGAGDRAAAGGD